MYFTYAWILDNGYIIHMVGYKCSRTLLCPLSFSSVKFHVEMRKMSLWNIKLLSFLYLFNLTTISHLIKILKKFHKINILNKISHLINNVQGYPQRMRLQRLLYKTYTVCFLLFMISCNCKLVSFFAKSLLTKRLYWRRLNLTSKSSNVNTFRSSLQSHPL